MSLMRPHNGTRQVIRGGVAHMKHLSREYFSGQRLRGHKVHPNFHRNTAFMLLTYNAKALKVRQDAEKGVK